jgi:hypothetical protein
MPTYDDARAKSFEKVTTQAVTGVPLEVAQDHPLRRARYQPIQVCVGECVTDPCPCDTTPIIWVDESAVLAKTGVDRRTQAGDELYEFSIDVDASVVVESFRRVKVAEITRLDQQLPTPTGLPAMIVRPRPAALRTSSTGQCGDARSSTVRADPGCNDYEITEGGAVYCFVESSEHYCIYTLC